MCVFEYPNLWLNLRVNRTLITLKYYNMAYRITEDCAACGSCMAECPTGAISEGDIYKIDPNVCIDCGTCADACPMGAIVSE